MYCQNSVFYRRGFKLFFYVGGKCAWWFAGRIEGEPPHPTLLDGLQPFLPYWSYALVLKHSHLHTILFNWRYALIGKCCLKPSNASLPNLIRQSTVKINRRNSNTKTASISLILKQMIYSAISCQWIAESSSAMTVLLFRQLWYTAT